MTSVATGRPARRTARPAGLIFAVGVLVLVLTAVALVLAGLHHFAGTSYPVLPASLCGGDGAALPAFTGNRWITSWKFDAVAVAGVGSVALLYLSGLLAVRLKGRRWPLRRTVAFAAGLAVVIVATCGPIAVYDMAMFSVHMVGHLALVMVAPPLLVLGRPMTLALHATSNPWHRRIRAVIRSRALALVLCPPVALATYAVVIVGTHLTGLMDQIMTRPWAGQIEHLAYLLVGFQFFILVVGDEPLRWRLSMPAKELLLAVAMAIDTFTGVVLLQTTAPIAMTGMATGHVDPLGQTRIGGGIMWVGGDLIMAVVMVAIGVAWVRRPAHRRSSRRSWLEQTRRAVFDANTAEPESLPGAPRDRALTDIDEDDRARERYNAWLAGLNGREH